MSLLPPPPAGGGVACSISADLAAALPEARWLAEQYGARPADQHAGVMGTPRQLTHDGTRDCNRHPTTWATSPSPRPGCRWLAERPSPGLARSPSAPSSSVASPSMTLMGESHTDRLGRAYSRASGPT